MDGMKARSNNNTTNNNQIVEDKLKPDWAGDDILSKAVDAAISNKFLYEVIMKPMARKTLIDTAEKNGIKWREVAEELQKDERLQAKFNEIEISSMEYPEYYLKPCHA